MAEITVNITPSQGAVGPYLVFICESGNCVGTIPPVGWEFVGQYQQGNFPLNITVEKLYTWICDRLC